MPIWPTKKIAKKNEDLEITAVRIDPSLKLNPSNFSHIGARENQEDAFAFSDLGNEKLVEECGILAVVADGMGGLDCGEKASQAAVGKFIREHSEKDKKEPAAKFLRRVLTMANTAVYDLAYTGEEEIYIGTTLVAVLILGKEMHWISAGDSRIYLYRKSYLEQLTTDHIYANQLAEKVSNGLISRKEASEHPERNYLTSYLGLPELSEIGQNDKPLLLEAGDKILLCSDGLYDTLTEKEISSVLSKNDINHAEEMVRQTLGKNNTYQDNVTVVILNVNAA